MIEKLYTLGIPALLSITPVSLIIINHFSKLFAKHHPKLGKTTTICTEIEGILTNPNLEIKSVLFDKYRAKLNSENEFAQIEDIENRDKEEILLSKTELGKDQNLEIMATATTLCPFDKLKEIETVTYQFLIKCGFNKREIADKYNILQKVNSSKDKRYSTIVIKNKKTGEINAISKGNPIKILKKCTKVIINGKKIELNHQSLRKLRKRIDKMNKSGQKVIGYSIKPLPLKILENYSESFTEKEMTFIGAIGSKKPLDKLVSESVKISKKAGIKNYIITKEKEKNAVAIGIEVELINPQYFEAITGAYLKELNDKKLEKLVHNKDKDIIFCELTEKDKLRVLEYLRKDGEIIARTSAKQKNSYSSIVEGIEKGRKTNKNLRKFSSHAVTCKIAETILLVTAILFKAPIPLTITLILGLDIAINIILELSLRAEPVEANVMTEKYHPINRKPLTTTIMTGLSIGVILSTAYILTLVRYGWTLGSTYDASSTGHIKAITITFFLLLIIQIINSLNLRKKKCSILSAQFLTNIYLTLSLIITTLLVYIVGTFEQIQVHLGLTSLSLLEWEIIGFLVIIFLTFEELKKFILRHANSKNS